MLTENWDIAAPATTHIMNTDSHEICQRRHTLPVKTTHYLVDSQGALIFC